MQTIEFARHDGEARAVTRAIRLAWGSALDISQLPPDTGFNVGDTLEPGKEPEPAIRLEFYTPQSVGVVIEQLEAIRAELEQKAYHLMECA